jgi:hypothetical protein
LGSDRRISIDWNTRSRIAARAPPRPQFLDRRLVEQGGRDEFGQGQFDRADLVVGHIDDGIGDRAQQRGEHAPDGLVGDQVADLRRQGRARAQGGQRMGHLDQQEPVLTRQIDLRARGTPAIEDVAFGKVNGGRALPGAQPAFEQEHQPETGRFLRHVDGQGLAIARHADELDALPAGEAHQLAIEVFAGRLNFKGNAAQGKAPGILTLLARVGIGGKRKECCPSM